MAKRFSNYEWALKKLGGSAPPAGPIAEYQKYASGQKLITYDRDPLSKPGGRKQVGIEAFGFVDPDKAKLRVGVSLRAFTKKSDTTVIPGPAATALGWAALTDAYTRLYGFEPAKAVIFKPDAQTDAESTSKITGVKYNPREGASYTLPFGKVGTNGEADQAAAIAAALSAVAEKTPSVTFKPERIRQ